MGDFQIASAVWRPPFLFAYCARAAVQGSSRRGNQPVLFGSLPKSSLKNYVSSASCRRLHLSASRENVSEDSVALSRFQAGASGHFIDQSRPLRRRVAGDGRQGVTFNAARNEKRASFMQHGKIDMLFCASSGHLRSYWRRLVACRFATDEIDNANEPQGHDRKVLHFYKPTPKIVRT
jgi:hypothetical protein